MLRGQRAREPLFKLGASDVAGQYNLDGDDNSDSSKEQAKENAAEKDLA